MAAIQLTNDGDNNRQQYASRVTVRNSAGTPYTVLMSSPGSTFSIEVWKGNSTTPASFTEQDTGNRPEGVTYGVPACAIDSTDIIHIVYPYDNGKVSELRYVTFDADGTTDTFAGDSTVIADIGADPASFSNLFVAIAVDSNDIPHIAYTEYASNMGTDYYSCYYNNRVGGSWNASGVEIDGAVNSRDNTRYDIVINADDIPVVMSNHGATGRCTIGTGDANDPTSFTITNPVTAGNALGSNGSVSMVVDSSGVVQIFWVKGSTTKIFHDTVAGGSNTDTGAAPAASNTVISGVANGTDLYVFYEDASNDIAYYEDTGSGWGSGGVIETGTYHTARAKWAYFNNFDSAGAALIEHAVYYFDSSDAGPTDPEGVWTNDTNIDDGNEATTASNTSTGTGTASNEELESEGTNAPASGSTIDRVYVRFKGYTNNAINTLHVNVFTDARGEDLGGSGATISNSAATLTWSPTHLLTTPSGGWTWAKIQALQAVVYKTGGNATASHVSIIQIRVETDNPATEIDYSFSDETASPDIWWNALSLASGTAYTKELTESITIVDTKTLVTSKALSNNISLNDALTTQGTFVRALSETVTLVDSIAKQTSRAFAEAVTLTDSFIKQTQKNLTETITLTDVLATVGTFFKSLSDSVTLTDVVAKQTQKTFSEVVTLTDSVATVIAKFFTEVITLTDTIAKQTQKTFTETLTLIDNIATQATLFKVLSEAITLADNIAKQTQKTFAEAITLVDTIAKQAQKSLAETITLVDTLAKQTQKTLTEAVALTDSIIKQTQKTFTETITLNDIITNTIIFIRDLTENITLVDTVTKQTSRTFSEVITLVDSIARQTSKAFTEVVTLTDNIVKQTQKTFTETVTLVDSISKRAGKVLTETITLTDVLATVGTFFKSLVEQITLNDTISKVTSKALSETITLVDTIAKQTSKAFSEVITLVANITNVFTPGGAGEFFKTLTENITLVDTVKRQTSRTLSETLNLVDTIAKQTSRAFTEVVTLADTVVKQTQRTFAEAITLADTVVKQTILSLSETITIVDTITNVFTSAVKKGVSVLLTVADRAITTLMSANTILGTKNKDSNVLKSSSEDTHKLGTNNKDNTIV